MLTIHDVMGHKSHFVVVSINICDLRISVDRLVGKCILLSAVLLMCPYIHLFLPFIDQSIGGPSVDLCTLLDLSGSPLIDPSVNVYCCLLSC